MSELWDGNALINGNFDLWQRGTSASANGAFAADRWINVIVNCTQTISQQAFTLGQSDVPNNPTYFMRLDAVSAGGIVTDVSRIQQRIGSVQTFAGTSVTVDFWARRNAGSGDLLVSFLQSFGSGGSPSAQVETTRRTATLSTSWQRFAFVLALGGLSGKTLGTAGNDTLAVLFWTNAGDTLVQTITADIAQVQVRAGYGPVPYQARPLGVELQLAQQYYQKSFALTTAPVQNAGSATGPHAFPATATAATTQRSPSISFSTWMRAAPTVTLYNPSAANAEVRDQTAGANCSASAVVNPSERGFWITATGAAGTAIGNDLRVHWTADAEL